MKSSNPTSTSEALSQSFENEAPGSVKEMAGDAKRSASNMINQAKERAAALAEFHRGEHDVNPSG